MFTALKKLTTKSGSDATGNGGTGTSHSVPSSNAQTTGTSPGGMQTMDPSLQKKFARGCHYNMKLIIKGDRNTGKTCLFQRLQGKQFNEDYVPTDEIQVASIQWNYKAADDIVKVEVWDIVDKGKKRKQLDGLKVNNTNSKIPNDKHMEAMTEVALDAEFVDVYKGTHGVVFMFDVTKIWTFEYIQRELPKVPPHIPILIMANFIDMGHHRVVTRDQAVGFIEDYERNESTEGQKNNLAAEIRYAESSMRNGFGLKLLHKFLNVPYLMLQRETLLTQLALNQREIEGTQLELDLYLESDDANYEVFIDGVTRKRREVAECNAPKSTVDIVAGQPSNTIVTKTVVDKTKSKEDSAQKGLEVLAAIQIKQEAEKAEKERKLSPSVVSIANKPSLPNCNSSQQHNSPNIQNEPNGKLDRKSSPGKESLKSAHSLGTGSINSHLSSKHTNDSVNVDNFVPNLGDDGSGGGIDNFLDSEIMLGDSKTKKDPMPFNHCEESSEDEGVRRNNPMVAKVMDDDSDIEIDEVVNISQHNVNIESTVSNKGNNFTLHTENSFSSDDDDPKKLGLKGAKAASYNLKIPNQLVKKLSDTSISGSSEKSHTSRNSNSKQNISSDKKEENSDNNDFLFDLKQLPSKNMTNLNGLQDNNDSDERHKKHSKKSKKEKKEKKSSSGGKKSRKVKDERDDLEEFLSGSVSNKGNDVTDNGSSSYAAPEGYDEL